MVEVLNSYDTWIYISKLVNRRENFTMGGITDISINNYGNKEVFPIIEMTGIFTINNISNGIQIITFNTPMEVGSNNKLTLNFAEQIYELTDNFLGQTSNIIEDITIYDLITVKENTLNTYTFDIIGSGEITFKYDAYGPEEELHYVEQFNINKGLNYRTIKPFNGDKINKQILDDVKYTFSITKLQVDWLDEREEYRITYKQYNSDTYNEKVYYLIGVKLDRLDSGYNNLNEIIQDNISGTAINMLNKTN